MTLLPSYVTVFLRDLLLILSFGLGSGDVYKNFLPLSVIPPESHLFG